VPQSWIRSAVVAIAVLVAGATARAQETAAPGAPAKEPAGTKAAPVQPDPDKAAKPLTAQEQLDACRKLYETAKTYRDEGKVDSVIDAGAQKISDSKPFTTAFERDGRFRWQFEHSAMPGRKVDQKYLVWSDDQKTFRSRWTLMGKTDTFSSIDMAMAGPTGVSGGSATAVIPLLRPDIKIALRDTDLHDPRIVGTEKLDGVECTMIRGTQPSADSVVVLWLDSGHAIRKIKLNMDVDPSKLPGGGGASSKFKVETIITIKPTFDEKLDDKYFEPRAESK
jgi:hypothetical protein